MGQVSETIRKHHRELMKTLETHIKAVVEEQPDADPQGLATFLQDELLPHAMGEEEHLYPTVEPLLKTHGRATATMSIDHEFIQGYIRQINEAVVDLEDAGPGKKPAIQQRLQHLALQLKAVLRLHLEKEERVYLPLIEKYLSEEAQHRVLDGMHATYEQRRSQP